MLVTRTTTWIQQLMGLVSLDFDTDRALGRWSYPENDTPHNTIVCLRNVHVPQPVLLLLLLFVVWYSVLELFPGYFGFLTILDVVERIVHTNWQ